MKILPTLLLTITVAFVTTALIAQPHPQAVRHPLFAPLNIGTPISLKSVPGGYELVWLTTEPRGLSHTVVEVGADFIVVKDGGLTETRIPVDSVLAVKVVRQGDGPAERGWASGKGMGQRKGELSCESFPSFVPSHREHRLGDVFVRVVMFDSDSVGVEFWGDLRRIQDDTTRFGLRRFFPINDGIKSHRKLLLLRVPEPLQGLMIRAVAGPKPLSANSWKMI
ncbi:MAG: hypothetical protein N2C14_22160 [Planctomycetales bacterium]